MPEEIAIIFFLQQETLHAIKKRKYSLDFVGSVRFNSVLDWMP